MKVLYISHLHPPENQPLENIGGMQNVSLQLCDALNKKEGVELKTIVQRAPWEGIGLATTLFLFKLLVLVPKAIREFSPDVILFSSMVTAGVAPFLPRLKVPMVTINHGQDVTLPFWLYQKYLPFVFQRMNGVISVSKATRMASIHRGMAPEKGIALPNGLDERKSLGVPGRTDARKELARRFGNSSLEGKNILLTVGRQVKRKGHTWFIREVLPKIDRDICYLVIGDGPEYEEIKRAAEQSELRDSIILAGRQPDVILKAAYVGSDLFIMPNIPIDGDMEGFGIVLLEANQMGLPAIASDLEGIQDVIEQGVNGYRVEPCNADEFVRTIEENLNDKKREQLSVTSKEYVIEHFSWNKVINQYLSFLDNVCLDRT